MSLVVDALKADTIVLGVTTIIRDRDGRILLGKKGRSRHSDYIGKWVTPGGKVHYGERLRDAAVRELFEETGIRIPGGREMMVEFGNNELILDDAHYVFAIYYFRFDYFDHCLEPTPGSDITEVAWVSLAYLNQYQLTPLTMQLLSDNMKRFR